MTDFKNDPIAHLVKSASAFDDKSPLMTWEEFYSKHNHYLPQQKNYPWLPNSIIGLALIINLVLIYFAFPLIQDLVDKFSLKKAHEITSTASSSKIITQTISDINAFVFDFLNEDNNLSNQTVNPINFKVPVHNNLLSNNKSKKPTYDNEVIFEKISYYFDQLKQDQSDSRSDQYLLSLIKAKDSIDKIIAQLDVDVEFGVVPSKEKFYAEYLTPEDFINKSKDRKSVILDLRKPSDFKLNRIKGAQNVEFSLDNLEEFSRRTPITYAVFIYSSDKQELESAKAFLWKKGFKTIYILNETFDPRRFKRNNIEVN